MDAKEKQLEEINRYMEAMKRIASLCKTPTVIGYKKISKEMKIQGIAIGAMCDMGYLKKVGYGKYVWNTNAQIEPIMARNVINKVKDYYSNRHKIRLQEKMEEENKNEIVSNDQVIIKPRKPMKRKEKKEEVVQSHTTERTIKIFGITIYSLITRKV
jgi:preprotein translocase subunit Sss1